MITTGGPTAVGGERRGARPWVAAAIAVAAVAVVLAVALGSSSAGGGAADDPTSTGPQGAEGLALLLAHLGASVDTTGALPPPGRGVALVLVDHLTSAGRDRLGSWVQAGGTLVIADPTSDLSGAAPAEGATPDSTVGGSGPTAPDCSAPWVAGVDEIDLPATALLAEPPGAVDACFGGDGAWFAVERRVGAGTVVSLAAPDLWTNQHLGRAANSVLAADLLARGPGVRVAWLTGTVGGGRQTLLDVVPDRVDELLIGGLVAVGVLALWRARRLGRPVDEEVPVVIPGSELVGATGRLLARNGQRGRAAELLRRGLASDADAGRGGADVAATLDGPAPGDDGALLALAGEIERLRQELARDR